MGYIGSAVVVAGIILVSFRLSFQGQVAVQEI
jgi:hypothetical protein